MAKFAPPETFDFSRPAAWPEWRDRFLRFRLAAKLFREDGEVQVSSLIYAMGKEADKIYSTFKFPDGENKRNNFDAVLTKFNEHFIPKRNVIHERARFYSRQQLQGESVEQFLRTLRELSATCDFGQQEEESVRDRLVLGLIDTEVSQKLQLQADLTLKDAVDTARHHELIKAQLHDQRSKNVDRVWQSARGRQQSHSHHTNEQRGRSVRGKASSQAAYGTKSPTCGRCGRDHKEKANCPARGQTCHKCKKKGHFSSVCRSKNIHEVSQSQAQSATPPEYVLELDSVSAKTGRDEPWRAKLHVLDQDIEFKLDTGADVSIMPKSVYDKLSPKPQLKAPSAVLRGAGVSLDCIGEFSTKVHYKGKSAQIDIFVLRSETESLLSRKAVTQLGLVKRVGAISAEQSAFGEIDENHILCQPVKIALHENAEPYSVQTARRVPIPLVEKVKDELKRMEKCGVIEKIEEPTDWCAPMVPVPKSTGSGVRICTDFKRLNQAVKRERYVIPSFEDITHKLAGAKVFSKLDATSGFFQIPLDDRTAKLTTFMTPDGRYYYKRLPQGISSAPEIFQRTMESILQEHSDYVICFFDDILVFSGNDEEHETHLKSTLETLKSAQVKLNREKCSLRQREIRFLGFIIDEQGLRPDPAKVEAIVSLHPPRDVTELRRYLGMINFIGRHLENLSTVLQPLNKLLEKETAWFWGPDQEAAFQRVKELLTNAPTLAFYDASKPTVVSADASSFGLGAVLLQDHDGVLKPVAYCSRSLTPAEKGYAQIEKECLASVWACERFQRYLVGLEHFTLQTDHKPLVPLFNKKDISETPVRCQRMLLRMMRFNCEAIYTPGKNMEVADTLSRSPSLTQENCELEDKIRVHVDSVQASWPASDRFLDKIREETQKDVNLKAALDYTKSGWPTYKEDVVLAARDLFAVRGELSVVNGLLTLGDRIVVPYSMRKQVLNLIHQGHQGIVKCRERAKISVWWPRIGKDIQHIVSTCRLCLEKQPTQRKEPLLPSTTPERPFQRVGIDILEFKQVHYLITTDYFSRYIEIARLQSLSSQSVINKLKSCFARHGVPETVVSDNGTQFSSAEFKEFSVSWNFSHVTSSPHYPQSNGQAESGVKIAKSILRQEDPFQALLAYRSTPLPALGASPAQLAYSRNLRTPLPALPKTLEPQTLNTQDVRMRDNRAKSRQKESYDRRHGAQALPPLHPGDPVLVKKDGEKGWKEPATVLEEVAPRSYLLATKGGKLRRNRRHLRPAGTACDTPSPANHMPVRVFRSSPSSDVRGAPVPVQSPPDADPPAAGAQPTVQSAETPPPPVNAGVQSPPVYRTRSGRPVTAPAKLRE
jgi:transposase InsO family protein